MTRMMVAFFGLFLGIYASAATAKAVTLSEVTFLGEQAQVIFDLIKEPTHSRTFTFTTAGKQASASEKTFGDRLSCTAYGRGDGFPKSASEGVYTTCTLRAEVVRTRLTRTPNKGGIVEISGDTAKTLMGLITSEPKSERDEKTESTLVEKTLGISPAVHGLRCQKKAFDDAKKAAGFICRIAWID